MLIKFDGNYSVFRGNFNTDISGNTLHTLIALLVLLLNIICLYVLKCNIYV